MPFGCDKDESDIFMRKPKKTFGCSVMDLTRTEKSGILVAAMENISSPETKTHTISVLVENKFGVLSRVAGLFSGRGYNIHSLNVAPCEEPAYARMTIDVNENGEKLDQIIKQLSKLVNVVEVIDYRAETTVYREIVLMRVRFGNKKQEILELCNIFGAKVLDATREMLTIEISGGSFRLSRFLNLMSDYEIEMLTRSGKIAVVKPHS